MIRSTSRNPGDSAIDLQYSRTRSTVYVSFSFLRKSKEFPDMSSFSLFSSLIREAIGSLMTNLSYGLPSSTKPKYWYRSSLCLLS